MSVVFFFFCLLRACTEIESWSAVGQAFSLLFNERIYFRVGLRGSFLLVRVRNDVLCLISSLSSNLHYLYVLHAEAGVRESSRKDSSARLGRSLPNFQTGKMGEKVELQKH